MDHSLLQPALLAQYLLSAEFFWGAAMTLWLSIALLAVGLVIGLVLAVGQEALLAPVRWVVWVYIWSFRGTPVLLQLVFAFNVLPSLGVLLPGFACAVLALGLNEGAYMAEILRSGIRAVGPGQRLAARAGSRGRTGNALGGAPAGPIGNQLIGMPESLALVSVIAVKELLLVADENASGNFRYIETLTTAGLYYLALTTVFMLIQSAIERGYSRRPAFWSPSQPAASGLREGRSLACRARSQPCCDSGWEWYSRTLSCFRIFRCSTM